MSQCKFNAHYIIKCILTATANLHGSTSFTLQPGEFLPLEQLCSTPAYLAHAPVAAERQPHYSLKVLLPVPTQTLLPGQERTLNWSDWKDLEKCFYCKWKCNFSCLDKALKIKTKVLLVVHLYLKNIYMPFRPVICL